MDTQGTILRVRVKIPASMENEHYGVVVGWVPLSDDASKLSPVVIEDDGDGSERKKAVIMQTTSSDTTNWWAYLL